jgi:hypothetical protein
MEADAGKRRVEIEAGDAVRPFEKKILRQGRCGALLPCVLLAIEEKCLIRYDTTGYLSFAEYPFRALDQVLHVFYRIPALLIEAEDYLLRPAKCLFADEAVFVHAATGEPKLLYGSPQAAFRQGYESLLSAAAQWDYITGLPSAIRQIQERISAENPDLRALLRIVEGIRREWSYIQPL